MHCNMKLGGPHYYSSSKSLVVNSSSSMSSSDSSSGLSNLYLITMTFQTNKLPSHENLRSRRFKWRLSSEAKWSNQLEMSIEYKIWKCHQWFVHRPVGRDATQICQSSRNPTNQTVSRICRTNNGPPPRRGPKMTFLWSRDGDYSRQRKVSLG